MIGVLHHIPDDAGKAALLYETAQHLRTGGSLVLAGNYRSYVSEPLLLSAWAARWRMFGADTEEVRAKQAKIMQGAAPPAPKRSSPNISKRQDSSRHCGSSQASFGARGIVGEEGHSPTLPIAPSAGDPLAVQSRDQRLRHWDFDPKPAGEQTHVPDPGDAVIDARVTRVAAAVRGLSQSKRISPFPA